MSAFGYLFILAGALLARQVAVGRAIDTPTDLRDLAVAFLSADTDAMREVIGKRGENVSVDDAGEVATGNASSTETTTWDGKERYSLGPVKPHVKSAGEELGQMFGIAVIGGWRATSAISTSDHPKGLALDFMCNPTQGDKLAPYCVANRKKYRITYVIWKQSINTGQGWSKMEDRGSPTANHMDHVHVSFAP